MCRELERARCLDGGQCMWSMWPGYLERESGTELGRWLDQGRIPCSVVHASGHAGVEDLQRLAGAIAPDRLMPVHTGAPERFPSLFEGVALRKDGEWWDV